MVKASEIENASLKKLIGKRTQLDARIDAMVARENERVRKLDTRRKVVIGALILERAKSDPAIRQIVMQDIAGLTRPFDRKAFENWTIDQ